MAQRVMFGACVHRWYKSFLTPYLIDERFFLCAKGKICPNTFPAVTPAVWLSQNVANRMDDKKRKKGTASPKISLLEPDGKFTVTTVEEAEKIAKRRDMKLVKVDPQSAHQKQFYKLMTASQYFEEELKSRRVKKDLKQTEIKEKILSISDKIEKHDLEAKVKMLKKWLEKRHHVRIIITESDSSLSAQVCKFIETSTNEIGKFVQKRQKNKEIKFSILPVIKEETDESEKQQ